MNRLCLTTLLSLLILLAVHSFNASSIRTKRASADQRIAELQALIALSRGGSVGHGQIDPYFAGKRKRADKARLLSASDLAEMNEIIQYILQNRLKPRYTMADAEEK